MLLDDLPLLFHQIEKATDELTGLLSSDTFVVPVCTSWVDATWGLLLVLAGPRNWEQIQDLDENEPIIGMGSFGEIVTREGVTANFKHFVPDWSKSRDMSIHFQVT